MQVWKYDKPYFPPDWKSRKQDSQTASQGSTQGDVGAFHHRGEQTHKHSHTNTHTHACVHHTHTHTRLCAPYTHVCAHKRTQTHIHACTHLNAQKQTHTRTCLRAHMQKGRHTHTHTHKHTNKRTHLYTLTHTHFLVFSPTQELNKQLVWLSGRWSEHKWLGGHLRS